MLMHSVHGFHGDSGRGPSSSDGPEPVLRSGVVAPPAGAASRRRLVQPPLPAPPRQVAQRRSIRREAEGDGSGGVGEGSAGAGSAGQREHLQAVARAKLAAWRVPDDYDYSLASMDYYKAAPGTPGHECYGDSPYAEVRGTRDYTFHRMPCRRRTGLQDAIIAFHMAEGDASDRPWMVFTAGAMGAGKSFTMRRLAERNLFGLNHFMRVDPDAIKYMLPEMEGYLARDRSSAGTMVHDESTFVSELVQGEGLAESKHLLVDGSLRNVDWYAALFQRIRQDYPHYRIAVLHVVASKETVYNRAAARAMQTGREVPRQMLDLAMEEVPLSVEKLGMLADYAAQIRNEEDADLVLERVCSGGHGWKRTVPRSDAGDREGGGDDDEVCVVEDLSWEALGTQFRDAEGLESGTFDDSLGAHLRANMPHVNSPDQQARSNL